MVEIGLLDWVLWLIYFFLIGFGVFFYKNLQKDNESYKYFLQGFLLKAFGGLSFAVIYIYYYQGGDTMAYFRDAKLMVQTFLDQPTDYIRLLFYQSSESPQDLYEYTSKLGFVKGDEEWFSVKVFSFFNLLSFNSYLVTTLLVSFLSFLGSWKLFTVFEKYVEKKGLAFIAVFVTPSVIFWGSGILKDTLAMFGLSILIWSLHKVIFERKLNVFYISIAVLSALFTFSAKSYVLILFLPALFVGLYVLLRGNIQNRIVRFSLTPILLVLISVFVVYGVTYLANASNKYKLSGLEHRVKGFHSWHTYQGGSVYSLGEMDYSTSGVISKIPASLNVTLFRPYPWEVRNFVMALSAMESLIILILMLRLLFRRFKNIKLIFQNPLFVMMLVYTVLLGFVVGFTSYNFGALARYKIPLLSMFAFVLLCGNFEELKPYISYKKKSSDQS